MINRFTAFDSPNSVRYIYPDELNTGDLLCVSYNNLAGEFVGSFTNSIWVHTGMVWVDPNTNLRYVLEGAIYGGSVYKNFFKIPFETWVRINKRNIMSWKKYNGPEIDPVMMINEFQRFNKIKLEGFNPTWLRFLINRNYNTPNLGNKLTCFEAIVILGQEMCIFKKDKLYSSYFPCDIVNNNIKTEDGIFYSENIQIKVSDMYAKILYSDMARFGKVSKK